MRGLIIRSPWIEKILSGQKTWEIRGSRTAVRGRIALIRSGSGQIVGSCELVDVVGPLTLADFQQNRRRHRVPAAGHARKLPYKNTYAWVLRGAKPLKRPKTYGHLRGAVIWVRLPA